jgi:hypothetical protein
MSIEAYTDGKQTLFRERRPAAYSGKRKALGVRQLAWIKARGWLAGPRVERKEAV